MNYQNSIRHSSSASHTPVTQPDFSTEQMAEIPDQKLFQLCQRYGEQARYFRQKFAGLLPEVFRRGLYEKKGFGSIYEFAAKLAGMSRKQVQRVLNLEEKFQSMPTLHAALIKGEVSAHKLVRVASIATPENEEYLVSKVKILSQSALEVLVRDEKYANRVLSEEGLLKNQNGLFKAKNRVKSVRTHTFSELKLDTDVETELLEMQHKGININELLREFLQKRKLELVQEKEQLAREQEAKRSAAVPGETSSGQMMKKPSRYIPVKIRRHLQQEYGTKCAIPACCKTADHVHHTARWSLSQNHDPNYLAPLCKGHHELAHSIDARVFQKKKEAWRSIP